MSDSDLIEKLGGPTQLARLLDYRKPGSVQRVQNWKARGIPARVKLARPDLFMTQQSAPELRGEPAEDAPASPASPAAAPPPPPLGSTVEVGYVG